jgi:hypothetical protein
MIFTDLVITPKVDNPSDYNIKGNIVDDNFVKLGDFGVDGTDIFTWWSKQDPVFQMTIINLFTVIMADHIISGTAE